MKPWPPLAVAKKFEALFQARFVQYWHPLTGFDVVKFDEDIIKAPDGVSTRDHVRAIYGQEALTFVEGLL